MGKIIYFFVGPNRQSTSLAFNPKRDHRVPWPGSSTDPCSQVTLIAKGAPREAVSSFKINVCSKYLHSSHLCLHSCGSSIHGTPKPTYLPPKDLPKYSPLQNSMQQLPIDSKSNQGKERQRKQVQRAFSVPNRPSRHQRQPVRRQTSKEELPTQCQDYNQDQDPCLEISSPSNVSN